MSQNFDKSEEYRKYIIGLQFEYIHLYTVWGTDMSDNESDKLLVRSDKLLAFENLEIMQNSLKDVEHPFCDVDNFKNWVNEENLKHVYNDNNIQLLNNFDLNLLKDKTSALEILNTLNLIQDFFIQIEMDGLNEIYDSSALTILKDFIYDNFFWKKKSKTLSLSKFKDVGLNSLLKELYNEFYSRIVVIQH